MHKFILSIGTVLASSLLTFGQISITIQGETAELAGSTHIVNATNGNEQIVDFEIKNNSASTKEWIITRKRLNTPPAGWTDYLCWGDVNDQFGGTCYSASQMATNPWSCPTSVFISPGGSGLLIVHVNPDDVNFGTGTYRYYVGRTAGSPEDSVDLEITTALAVKEIKNSSAVITTHPNPANDVITLSLAAGQNEAAVTLTDVLGKVVLQEKVSGSEKFDVSELKNGVYVFTIVSNGVTQTKRIVIRH